MSDPQDIKTQIDAVSDRLRDKLGARGATLGAALGKARLPRRVAGQARLLARAEAFADHPKLRLTLDAEQLNAASREVCAHLDAIDLADRRKGWWLGMAGGMAFNLLLAAALLIGVLVWRGLV